jgi:cysteine-rich repeat protein
MMSALILFVFGLQIVRADTDTTNVDVEFQVGVNVCGDGVVNPGEACDDGNLDTTDACLNTCVVASCGDGFVRTGVEACDEGILNGTCPATCSTSCVINSCGGTDPPPPPIPSVNIVQNTPSHTSIRTNWTVVGGTITGCSISWSTDPGNPPLGTTETYTIEGPIYSVLLTGLQPLTTYYITVICTNSNGRSGNAIGVAQTTDAPVIAELPITITALAELRNTTPYNHENLDFVVRMIDPGTGAVISEFSGITNNTTGVYTGTHSVPVGTDYIAEIKGLSHLSKRIVGVNTTVPALSLDFTDGGLTRLRAGDVRARTETNPLPTYSGKPPLNDDIIEGADLSLILSYFGTLGPSAYKILDFNRDGATTDYYITEGSELSTILSRFGTVITYSL